MKIDSNFLVFMRFLDDKLNYEGDNDFEEINLTHINNKLMYQVNMIIFEEEPFFEELNYFQVFLILKFKKWFKENIL